MFIVTSALSIVLVVTRPAHQLNQQTKLTPVETIQQELLPQPAIASVPEQEKAPTVVNRIDLKPEKSEPVVQNETSKDVAPEIKPLSQQEAQPDIAGKDQAEEAPRLWKLAFCNCDCNFGSNQEWVDEVLDELLEYGYVEDECNYSFAMTSKSFSANGKNIEDEKFIARMIKIFEEVTGDELTASSSISVSISHKNSQGNNTSCSMSINIDG